MRRPAPSLPAMQAVPPSADDPDRRLGDLLRYGTVASVDLAAGRATVRIDDDCLTPPLRWTATRAGSLRVWAPPAVGEQVIVLCPEGEIAAGVIGPSLYFDAVPAPAGGPETVITGPGNQRLTLEPGGDIVVTTPGTLRIAGDVEIAGTLTATGDVAAGGVSLKTHRHGQVAAGAVQSGPPAP